MRKVLIILIAGVILFTGRAFAQPSNDDCINAITLVASPDASCNNTAGTNAGVLSADYDNCAEFSKRNVWYKFIATAGTHIVQVTFGTMQQGIINAFANGCGTLTHLNCGGSGQTGPVIQRILNGLTVGQEYLVAVSTREQNEEGSFDICITTPPAPANDNCGNAVALTVNTSNVPLVRTNGTTLFATQSQPACTGNADDDVWYSFVATQAVHRVYLFYSGNNFSMEAFSGNCGSLVSISCGTPSGLFKTRLLNGLTPGQTYFIRIYSTGGNASDQGSFQIAITSSPLNDECANAVPVTASANGNNICTSSVAGATFDATQSSPDCFGGNGTSNDTWFSFTATQSVHTIKVYGFGSNSIRFQAMSGTCGSLNTLFCNTPLFSGDTAIQTIGGLSTGQTYFLRVYSGNSGGLEGLFNVCITSPVFPVNDECLNASVLVPASDSTINYVNGTSAGSTNVPVTGSCNDSGNDVWYRFTATSAQHVLKAINLTNISALQIEVWSGTCASLIHQRCSVANDTLFGIGNLTIGQTYFVRVYNTSAFFGDNFQIAVFTPQPLSNDECGDAIAIIPTADASCVEIGGTILGATQSRKDNPCAGNALIGQVSDVWYKFVASSASHRVRLIKGTGTLSFQVLTGSCGSLTNLGCSAELSGVEGTTTEVRYDGLTIGVTYFVRILNTAPSVTGTFDLCVKTVVVPVNNECAAATALVPQNNISFGSFAIGISTDATSSAQPTSCSTGQDDDVWYQFTATQANMQVILQNGTISTTRIAVYSGTCGALALVKCQLGNARDNAVLLTGLAVGTNYFVRVYSSSTAAAAQGTFAIMVTTQYNPPVNDDCTNATELFPSTGNNCVNTGGTTIDASPSGNTSCVNGNEVWYRFVATAGSHRINVEGLINSPVVTVFSGTCAALTQLPSVCNIGSLQVSTTANGLTIGTTYFIKVLAFSNAAFNQSIFNICITTPQVPANNECVNAVHLPIDPDATSDPVQQFTTNLATFSGIPNCSVFANDVWFSFIAPAEQVSVEVNALNANPAVELLTGNCGSLVSVVCNGINASQLNNVINTSNLVTGSTYFIRVSSTSFSTPMEFKIKVYKNLSAKLNNSIDSICLSSNLVQNPGFENDLFIPTSFIGSANPGTEFISNWRLPTRGTADFFNGRNSTGSAVDIPYNLCFGRQSARNGYGYAGFFAYSSSASVYREYLENQLSAPMIPGRRYLVSMYVSLGDFSSIAIDNIGIAFRTSQTREVSFTNLPYTAQVVSPDNVFIDDKRGWVNISAAFIADQPYRYLVIGNFKNNTLTDTIRVVDTSAVLTGGTFAGCATTSHSAYYFVDDVMVSEINGAVSGCGVLPLQLLNFTGKKLADKNQLNWKTDNEQHTSYFELQRSHSGADFISIGNIAAFNTPGQHNYSFTDNNPFGDVSFYRLKQVDIDGRSQLSQVVRISREKTGPQLRIWPNPATDMLMMEYNGSGRQIVLRIFDNRGALIKNQNLQSTSTLSVNIQSLAKGLYWIELSDGELVQRSSFMKQ